MENIAIVTVAYNRVKSLSRLLNSLLCADIDNAPLIISIDKSNTNEVERYANDFIWPYGEKKVITHKENLGLRKHTSNPQLSSSASFLRLNVLSSLN